MSFTMQDHTINKSKADINENVLREREEEREASKQMSIVVILTSSQVDIFA
jgi:hypothetical protein